MKKYHKPSSLCNFCGQSICLTCSTNYYIYKLANNKNDKNIGCFTLNIQVVLDILHEQIINHIKNTNKKIDFFKTRI